MSQPPECTVNYFCVGAILIFVGSILLCGLGFTIVLPYEATREWEEVICHVTNSSYSRELCSCQRQLTEYQPCIFKYPCLEIHVTYRLIEKRNTTSELNEETPGKQITQDATSQRPESTSRYSTEDSTTSAEKLPSLPTVSSDGRTVSTGELNANNSTTATGTEPENQNATENSTTEATAHKKSATLPLDELTKVSDDYDTTPGTHNKASTVGDSDDVTLPETDTTLETNYPALLYRNWGDSFHKTCALQECGDEEWNVRETSRFRLQYGRDEQLFTCFRDPLNPATVIVDRVTRQGMLHAIIWPAVSLFVGASLWIGLCLGCCTMENGEKYEGETNNRRKTYNPLPSRVIFTS